MQPISSKIKLSKKNLIDLYETLSNDKLVQDTDNNSTKTFEDLTLINFSLKQKIEGTTKNKKDTYIIELNSFEILYIQFILLSILPYLWVKTTEYQNYMSENRDNLNECELCYLKENYNNIFTAYQSLNGLMEKVQSLNEYHQDNIVTIKNMQLEERINAYIDMEGQLEIEKSILGNIIPIHLKL